MSRDRLRLRLVDDAAPEQVPVVRRERVDLAAVLVEREREVLAVLDPEVAVEASLQIGRVGRQAIGERRVLPDLARQPRAAQLRVVGVALQLARRAREARELAVAERDRVPRVLPALVLEPGLLVSPPIPDVAGALEIRVLVDPGESRARLDLELAHERTVAGPALVLVEEHDVERRRVHRAVVRRVRPLLEGRHLAVAHLVEDPAGILVAEVVEPYALPVAERRSVVAASSGVNGSACRLVKMLSRPNIVMNHGSPAAGSARPPAIGGEKRSAARSTRLRRYVASSDPQSHSRRGASAIQRSRSLRIRA